MIPERQINEFVDRLREAAHGNLQSVILYGSAVSGDFHVEFSNVNLLCVLHETSFQLLQLLSATVNWWGKQGQPAPLFVTAHELERSTDVFTIELLDLQQNHRVLFGDNVIKDLQIPMHLHRVQVEYELREKLILLRRGVLIAGRNDEKLMELLVRSVSSFATLFRHALIALSQQAPNSKREAVESLGKHIGFDPAAILQVLDIRERKIKVEAVKCKDVCSRYLATIEKVTAAVDEGLQSSREK